MCLALSLFDEFAVGYASSRPGLGEMVGVELEKAFGVGHSADNDVFAVFGAFFDGVHGSPEGVDAFYGHKITHATSSWSGNRRKSDKSATSGRYPRNYLCFQMSRHAL